MEGCVKKKPYFITLVAHLIMLVSLMGAGAFEMIPQALAFVISGVLAARMGAVLLTEDFHGSFALCQCGHEVGFCCLPVEEVKNTHESL